MMKENRKNTLHRSILAVLLIVCLTAAMLCFSGFAASAEAPAGIGKAQIIIDANNDDSIIYGDYFSFGFALADPENDKLFVDFGDGNIVEIDDARYISESYYGGLPEGEKDYLYVHGMMEGPTGSLIKIYSTGSITEFIVIDSLYYIDVTNCTGLTYLDVSNSYLGALDVSKNTRLEHLDCRRNYITELDVSNCPELVYLDCNNNDLSELDVSNNTKLVYLDCSDTPDEITPLAPNPNPKPASDPTPRPAGKIFHGHDDNGYKISELDVTNNPLLEYLYFNTQNISEIDLSNQSKLTELSCFGNSLAALDLTGSPLVKYVNCGENLIESVDISKCLDLEIFYAFANMLDEVDFSVHEKLKEVDVMYNFLTSLSFPKAAELINIFCGYNELEELDVTNNPMLDNLQCECNLLTELDLSGCPELTCLWCSDNYIGALDIPNYEQLENFYCENNALWYSTLNIDYSNIPDDWKYFACVDTQYPLLPETIYAGQSIDLSAEYAFGGTETEFIWYDFDAHEFVTPTSSEDGVFTFGEEFIGKNLECTIYNEYVDDQIGMVLYTSVVSVVDAPPAPAAPTLEAHSVGYTSVKLTWTPVEEADGYEIFRTDVAGKPYEYVTSADADQKTYTDAGLSTGTTYYYKVRAYKLLDSGEKIYSELSNYQAARPIPATPVLTVKRTSATTATVSWVRIYGATGYSVYRSTEKDGPYTFVANLTGANSTTYTATGLASTKTYYYKVRACREMGDEQMFSNYSLPGTAVGAPAVPVITARSVGYTSARVQWDAVPGADGYAIYRCDVGGGAYSFVANVDANTTVYTNAGLSTGTTYYYKVRAFVNLDGSVLYSNYSAYATARPIPATPVVTANDNGISWVKIYGATGYSVYRSTEKDGEYTFLAGIADGTTTTFTDSTAADGVTYYYKVRAYRQMGSDKMFSNYSLPCAFTA